MSKKRCEVNVTEFVVRKLEVRANTFEGARQLVEKIIKSNGVKHIPLDTERKDTYYIGNVIIHNKKK